MSAGLFSAVWLVPVFTLLTLAVGLGVVVGFHRLLTHRAVVLARPLEVALVILGLPAGTPVGWVGHHRHHHAHADAPEDLHSPKHRGFWVAHTGWYLGTTSTALSVAYALAGPLRTVFDAWWRPRTNQDYAHLANDVASDGLWGPLSRPFGYAVALLSWVGALWLGVWVAFGAAGLVALWVFHIAAYNFGDFVNSWGHTWGRQSWTGAPMTEARDHWLLALLTLGDGWHAGHHAFPRRFALACSRGSSTWRTNFAGSARASAWLGSFACRLRPTSRVVVRCWAEWQSLRGDMES